MNKLRVGADVGGTFTDVVAQIDDRYVSTKVLTTHSAPEVGILQGIEQLRDEHNLDLSQMSQMIHGTTLATNALIERRGAKTAFVTTKGFRDVIETRTEGRFEQYDLNIVLPTPLIQRSDRFCVVERMGSYGKALVELDLSQAEEVAEQIKEGEYDSVAVGFLHSYENPSHEIAFREILRAKLPDVAISISSEVSPQMREFERFNTVCANAYVQPLMASYLHRLEAGIEKLGADCPVFLIHSGGGLISVQTAAAFPVRLVESGPAGGAIFAAQLARKFAQDKVLSFDMGGTTAKIALIDDYVPQTAKTFEVARTTRFKKGSGMPISIPVIEMIEIGAGGGSIASIDGLHQIKIGPHSAGSEPGPAAYGRGGELPTVTDADVLLNRIEPASFGASDITLNPKLAAEAVEKAIAAPLDITVEQAGEAIAEIVDESMTNAARVHAVENGKDLNGYAMIAFGGAAPLHACRLMDKLAVSQLLIPNGAGVGSAIGFLMAPFSYEALQSFFTSSDDFDVEATQELLQLLYKEARSFIAGITSAEQATNLEVEASVSMRYRGQGWEIPVALDGIDFDSDAKDRLIAEFKKTYQRFFGRAIEGLAIETVSWAVKVSSKQEPITQLSLDSTTNLADATPIKADRFRQVFDPVSKTFMETAVIERDSLKAGDLVLGPAVIVEKQTTTVLHSHHLVRVLGDTTLLLTRNQDASLSVSTTGSLESCCVEKSAVANNAMASSEGEISDGESIDTKNSAKPLSPAGTPNSETAASASLLNNQIMWNRLIAIVEEQALTLIRTSFSTSVREAGDLSAGIFDAEGRLIAQAVTGTPGHVNTMAAALEHFIADIGKTNMEPGDVYITNDPWKGTGHLHDITVVSPVFLKTQLIGFFASTSHVVDVGGRGYGPDGKEVYEEGLCIPIMKWAKAGELNQDLVNLIANNVRESDQVLGDIHALSACNETARRRLDEMIQEFELDDLKSLAEYVFANTHDAVMQALKSVPNGVYESEMTVDGYDHPVHLAMRLTVTNTGMHADFSGTSPTSAFGINVPIVYAQAYFTYAVIVALAPELPNNFASLAPFTVSSPDGTILNAKHPNPVSVRHVIGHFVTDLTFGALAKAIPERIPAEGSSALWNFQASARSADPAKNPLPPVEILMFNSGGTGARPTLDGLSATAFPSGVMTMSTEATEQVGPMIIWRKELREASAGLGRFRGGLGQIIEISASEGYMLEFSAMFDRVENPARGRNGGQDGAAGKVYLDDGTPFRTKGKQTIPPQRHLIMELPGGGGFGSFEQRDPSAQANDEKQGYL